MAEEWVKYSRNTGIYAILIVASMACGDNTSADHDDGGSASGATCPTDSSLTYANFAQSFMTQYCTDCHATGLRGSARQGAPSDHNFDTLDAIRGTETEHIDATAASGPAHTNTQMPPADYMRQPTLEERRQLGEWLACGMR